MMAFGCIPSALTLQGEALGWSASDIGLLFTSAVIGRIAALFFGPYIMRYIGLNTFVPIAFALMTMTLALPALRPEAYSLWMGHEVIRGLILGPIYIIFDLWLYARTRESEYGRIFTIYMLACMSGYALGPLMIAQTGVGPLGFALCTGASLIAAIPVLVSKIPHMVITPPTLTNLGQLLRGNYFLWIVCFLGGYAGEGVLDFLGIFGLKNGMDEQNALMLMSCFVAGGLVMQYPLATLMDRTNKTVFTLIMLGAGVLAAVWLAFSAWSGVGILSAVFMMGALCSLMAVVGSSLLGEKFSATELMLATVMLNIFYDAGSFVGPLLNGAMIDTFGALGLPAAMGIVFSVGAILALYYLRVPSEEHSIDNSTLTPEETRALWAKIHLWTDNSMYIHAKRTRRLLANIARTPCVRMKWLFGS
jgi:MFS family permease